MVAEDCLRLAWEADRDGRRKLRDSLLTLAVVESGPEEPWAERCRARLVADRPEHYLGGYPNIRAALEDPRVIEARERLRAKHPEARIAGLLLTARSARGPYTGRAESLDALLDDLVGPPAEAENVRRDAPQIVRGPLTARLRSLRSVPAGSALAGGPAWDDAGEPPMPEVEAREDLSHFYLTVLIAIAMLIASTGPNPGD